MPVEPPASAPVRRYGYALPPIPRGHRLLDDPEALVDLIRFGLEDGFRRDGVEIAPGAEFHAALDEESADLFIRNRVQVRGEVDVVSVEPLPPAAVAAWMLRDRVDTGLRVRLERVLVEVEGAGIVMGSKVAARIRDVLAGGDGEL